MISLASVQHTISNIRWNKSKLSPITINKAVYTENYSVWTLCRRVDCNFLLSVVFLFTSHSRYTAVLQYKQYSNLYQLIYFYHCHTAQCNLSMYLHSILYVLLCNYLCVNKCIFYVCVQFLFGFVSVCNRAEALQTESNAYGIGL